MKTLAMQYAREIQTDKLMRKGIFATLQADHVCTFTDRSLFLDVHKGEIVLSEVMARHGYEPYTWTAKGAEATFHDLLHELPSALFSRERGGSFQVVLFTGWESENGEQLRMPARFLTVADVTKIVEAVNEAEEISEDDLEAAAAFLS